MDDIGAPTGDVEMSEDVNAHIDDHQEPRKELDLPAMDAQAEHNLEIKWHKVGRYIKKPSLHDIYFNADSLITPHIDEEYQLDYFFKHYNGLARWGFVAEKTTMQPMEISRTIFYYGVDHVHCFSRYSIQVRYNIILMAFVWASGFNTKYCREGCKKFVKAFIRAWLESLVYEHDIDKNSTSERDIFFEIWKHGAHDLYYFNERDVDKMKKRLKWLRAKMSELEKIPTPHDFLLAVRDGRLDESLFDKYGAVLALQWVMGYEAGAKHDQANIDRKHEERTANQIDVAEEGSLFGHGGRPLTLSNVDWDEGIISALLEPIDPTLPHPKTVKLHHRNVDETTFWITKDQIFKEIFKVDKDRQDVTAEMGLLAKMMEEKLGVL